ncbi:MAG TPA: Rieske (2Fe-2S) protein [Actinomycetota bacterium]|nr:Rieske (2Fe-2S) protein [Actinomycetota bacterium]
MKRAEMLVRLAFAASMVASIALVVLYLRGGERTAEGVLLGVALGGLGLGITVWATRLMDPPEVEEAREPLASPDGKSLVDMLRDEEDVTRRVVLVRMLLGAAGTLVAALAIPTLSLGPAPGSDLGRTKWRRGLRAVGADGRAVRPLDIPLEGVRTIFPEGFAGEPDSQAVVIRVAPGLLELEGRRAEWAPEDCVAYSKICTHAGCPVGLYRSAAHELLCPCHQSTFDVLRGAVPLFGPAVRPLPQLPLAVDEEGYLVALSDFTEAAGPSYWNIERSDEL